MCVCSGNDEKNHENGEKKVATVVIKMCSGGVIADNACVCLYRNHMMTFKHKK